MSSPATIQFTGAYPPSPKHLESAGKAMWAKGNSLWISGALLERDLDAWQMLCEAYDEIAHCESVLKEHGEYQRSSQGGFVEHPAFKRIRSAEGKIMKFQKLFGLVPDARKKRPAVQQGVVSRKK